jgi:hypothetical protein
MSWFLHKALLNQHKNFDKCSELCFPQPLPEGYDEPMGIEFPRYAKWAEVQMEIN